MKTFKQHLNALEKQRKLEKTAQPNDGVMPVYVHGKHAAEPTDNSFPNYVHGKHASNKINEEADTGSEPNDLRDWFDNHNKNVNDGKGLDSLHAELANHYHEDLSNHPDSNHVVDYTKESGEFNRALIRSHKSGVSDIEPSSDLNEYSAARYNKRKDGIDKAITATPAPKDFDTYAGVGFDPRRIMNEKNEMYSPAYLSSSIDPRIAHSFSHELDSRTGQSPRDNDSEIEKHILKIPVKQYQTNGTYVDTISNFKEKEFLHARSRKYKINPTPKTLTSKYGGLTHIWTANPIED